MTKTAVRFFHNQGGMDGLESSKGLLLTFI